MQIRPDRGRLAACTLCAVLGAASPAPSALAQGVITGTHTGADGTAVSGPGSDLGDGYNILGGNAGQTGVSLFSSAYSVQNATLTGGTGGEATGTAGVSLVIGGDGGDGLDVQQGATVTVESGTLSGGVGGVGAGQAPIYLAGGYGGDGIFVNAATAVIHGGTFLGGKTGGASGTAPELTSYDGGYGLNVNDGAVVTITGGNFTGGDGASITNPSGSAYDGYPGDGVIVLGGTVSIYGGTFTGGGYDPNAPHGTRYSAGGYGIEALEGSATLYGSRFTVNGVANFTGAVPEGAGTITAQLQDNAAPTTFSYYLDQNYPGTIVVVAAPEPSQAAALGLGILGVAGLALRTRRRRGLSA